jgi:hypothetical protein
MTEWLRAVPVSRIGRKEKFPTLQCVGNLIYGAVSEFGGNRFSRSALNVQR